MRLSLQNGSPHAMPCRWAAGLQAAGSLMVACKPAPSSSSSPELQAQSCSLHPYDHTPELAAAAVAVTVEVPINGSSKLGGPALLPWMNAIRWFATEGTTPIPSFPSLLGATVSFLRTSQLCYGSAATTAVSHTTATNAVFLSPGSLVLGCLCHPQPPLTEAAVAAASSASPPEWRPLNPLTIRMLRACMYVLLSEFHTKATRLYISHTNRHSPTLTQPPHYQ